MSDQILITGVAWYKAEEYSRMLEIMDDADTLHDTYEEWLAAAADSVEHMKRDGRRIVKAHIDPETFPAWCAAKGLRPDSKGRTEFANYAAIHAQRS